MGMSYNPVYPPYEHQAEALAKMAPHPAFGLLMGTRTGKTKVLVDDFGRREDVGEVRDFLGVAPAGALYGEDTWETQLPEHMPAELRERARYLPWRSADTAARRREVEVLLRESDPKRPRVLLVNIESLSSVKRARDLCREFLATSRALGRGAYMAVGESTCIKGQDSERGAFVQELGPMADVRRIETGLVAPHSPMDLFNQFYFLDKRILKQHSWFGFRSRYAVVKRVCFLPRAEREKFEAVGRRLPMVDQITGFRNEDELAELIAPYTYRKELRDCRDAPSTYRFRDVEMTPEQRRIYDDLRDNATAELTAGGGWVTAERAMTRIMRLHQVACGFSVNEETGEEIDLPERRTAALLDVLSDHGGKAVIWCTYQHNIRKVVTTLRRHFGPDSTAAFWGGNLATREDEERRFKGDAACRFMVGTPSAGGKGREWSCADLMVYYSNSPDLEHRHQSEARIEAMSKVDPVTRVDLRCPGTVDDRWINNLRNKITMASTLQGDAYREWLI